MKTRNTGHFHLKKQIRTFSGFTLVELIVVITILVILGTIAFVSLGWYSGSARDGSRVSDLANISKGLDITKIKTGNYPSPSSSMGITFSWGIVWYQGTIGESVVSIINSAGGIKLSKKPTDPKYTSVEYSYSVSENNKEYQLGAVMENNNTAMNPVIASAYAATDSLTAYLKGNYNGIMTQAKDGSGTVFILALPSMMLKNAAVTDLKNTATQSGNLVLHKKGNLPGSYSATVQTPDSQIFVYTPLASVSNTTGSGILAAVGLPTDTQSLTALSSKLRTIYGSSGLATDSSSASQIATFLASSTQDSSLASLLQGSFGGVKIDTGNDTDTGSTDTGSIITSTNQWTGDSTNGFILKDELLNPIYPKNCNDVLANANQTFRVTGAGSPYNGNAFIDWVYYVDPDGATTTISPFKAYCDMTATGGWWTILLHATYTASKCNPTQITSIPNLTTCWYLPIGTVKSMADTSSSVKIIGWTGSITSSGSNAVLALRNNTHWHFDTATLANNANYWSWAWFTGWSGGCPTYQNQWPNMYHAGCNWTNGIALISASWSTRRSYNNNNENLQIWIK